MKITNIYMVLIFIAFLVQKIYMANRIFTCGIAKGYPEESDAQTLPVDSTWRLTDLTIILTHFNISERINLFNEASRVLDKNVVVLIEGSEGKTSACALSTVTGIPLIRLHGNIGPFDQCENAIQMSAGYKDYAHATLDIIKMFRWENIAIVFDEVYLHQAAYFQALTQKSNLTVNLIQFPVENENEHLKEPVSKVMEEIDNLEAEVILLYIKRDNLELMLQQKTCPFRNGYKWILQGEVPLNLTGDKNDIVLALKLPVENGLKRNYTNSSDFVPIVYDAFQVINQALNRELCSSINGSSIGLKDMTKMLACLQKVKLDGLTGPVHFNEHGKRKEIELEILNLQNNSMMNIGTWNLTQGAVLFRNALRNIVNPSPGGRLEGRKLRVVVIENPPFIRRKEEDGDVSYEGYCIDLLNELARTLKFTYEIYPCPDGLYGAEVQNGTWNGMIGELVSKRADIAVSSLTITESREKVVDFSVAYMHYTREILIKKTTPEGKVDLLQFMNPFHSLVWLATLACLVIFSVAVFVINYYSPYGYKDDNGRGTSQEFSFFNSVWFSLACMLQQGGDNTPRSLSGRILTGCYWFCILIWISTYTANLTAFFAVKDNDFPVNNLEDIVKSSYHVAVIESSSTFEAFKTSQYGTHRKIWERMVAADSFVQSTSEGIQMVRDRDQFVFITDGPVLKHAARQPPCNLTTVPGLSMALGFGFAFQANDTAVDDVTLVFLHLHENGFIDNLRREWWEFRNKCPKKQETTLSRKRINLISMLGVYVVMGVGVVVALLAMTAEILWKRRKELKIINKRPKLRSIQVRPNAQQANSKPPSQ